MDLAIVAEKSGTRRKGFAYLSIVTLVLSFAGNGNCQGVNESVTAVIQSSASESINDVKAVTEAVFTRIFNISNSLGPEILLKFGFCMKNVQNDWNRAFNFSGNMTFIQDCVKETKGDLVQRVCNAAEIKFYFANMLQSGSKDMKPNKNCNLTTWLSGCEPGWACAVDINYAVDLKDIHKVPSRTRSCKPCCGGFFCPHGLTCMMPCPHGSYCPLGQPNSDTGYCDPYKYKLPTGQPNHTCGGADYWADIKRSREVILTKFC